MLLWGLSMPVISSFASGVTGVTTPPWAGPEGVDSEESEGPLRLVRLVGSVGPPGLASLGGRKQLQVSDHRMKLGNEMATSWPVGRKHSWGILSWVKPQRQPLAYP